MTLVLVTGASGFIASALSPALASAGLQLRATYRSPPKEPPPWEAVVTGPLSAGTDWRRALDGVGAVIHLAGPAHARFTDAALDDQIARATAALAAQAESAGVSRFVYVSSIKAACGRTEAAPINEDGPLAPEGAYGRAKRAAEQSVLTHPGLNPIVLRPPLVIGPNAKANFAKLTGLAASGLPLPLAALDNRRSLISVSSLVDAISLILTADTKVTGVFHLADAPALSSGAIVTALREGMGIPPRLFAGPRALLPRALRESLWVDDARFRAAFGSTWSRDARLALVACGAAWRTRQ